MLKKNIAVFLCFLLISLFAAAQDDSSVRVNNVKVNFDIGINSELLETGKPLIIQLEKIPDKGEKIRLEKAGIKIIRYLSGNAYLAQGSTANVATLEELNIIRGMSNYSARMKVTPELVHLSTENSDKIAVASINVYVRVFPGIPFKSVKKQLEGLGISLSQEDYFYNGGLYLSVAPQQLLIIAELSQVDTIDSAMNRARTHDLTVDKRLNLKPVRQNSKFLKADGANSKAGWWDTPAGEHPDLEDRLIRIHTVPGDLGRHGIGTAGIAIGSGKMNHDAKGIAPGGIIYSYNAFYSPDQIFDFTAPYFLQHFKEAVDKYGIRVSNNSWGDNHGFTFYRNSSGEIEAFWFQGSGYGVYNFAAFDQDKLARENDVLIFRSSGNERGAGYLGPYKIMQPDNTILRDATGQEQVFYSIRPIPDYFTVAHRMTSKNIIVVGAVTPDEMLTRFANCGPTNGGVLKPDLVAQGEEVLTTSINNGYEQFGGTSASCPIVTGSAMLLDDYHFRLKGENLSANMLKALLLHSARDIAAPGPDYLTGFGVPDVELGAKMIQNSTRDATKFSSLPVTRKNKSRTLMLEGELDHKESINYSIIVPEGGAQLRVTLVWKDAPGERLINNLDMWMTGNSRKKIRPFALNPNKPSELAQKKKNKYDNVEHILLEKPAAGTYKVFVKGTKVPEGPQPFALIFSLSPQNSPQKDIKTEGDLEITRIFITRQTPISADEPGINLLTYGDKFFLNGELKIKELPEYADGVYGTVASKFTITNDRGDLIYKKNGTSTNMKPGTRILFSSYNTFPLEIPLGMERGKYSYTLLVELTNGKVFEKTMDFEVR